MCAVATSATRQGGHSSASAGSRGIAVCDDYQIGWPEVGRAVDEAGLSGLVRIESRDFAVYHAP